MLEYAPGKIVVTISIMVAYFLIMFITAFIFKGSKMKENTVEEFAVGSRSFNWILVMFTYVGTFTSSTLYTSWFTWAGWEGEISMYIIAYSGPCYLFMYMMSKKAYVWGKDYKMLVMPDFVRIRYGSENFTKFFAIMALLIEAPWAIMEFYAMGSLVEAITYGTIPHRLATIIIVAFVMSYIFYSGMRSIAWTELLQGILTSIVVGIFFIIIVFKLYGGFGEMWQGLYEILPENLTVTYGGAYDINYWTSVVILATLGNLCQLSYFTRLFTAKSPLNIKKSAFIGGLITLFVVAMQFTMASGLQLIPGVESVMENDLAAFGIADYVFGPWFLGIMAIVVIAAGMSLVATVMSAHSVTISEVFLKNTKKQRSEEERVKLIRIILVIYTIVCLIIALMNLPDLYSIALCLFEGLLQFVPMMLFGVFWKRANLKGIASGFILGLIITYAIYLFCGNSVMGYTGGIFGGIVNCLCIIIFGLLSKPEARVEKLFKSAEEYIDSTVLEDLQKKTAK